MLWPTAEPIDTTRLTLEPLTVEHAVEMVEPLSSPQLYTHIDGQAPSQAELRRLYSMQTAGESPAGDAGWLNWIIRRKDLHDTIGYVQATLTISNQSTEADIAWVVSPAAQCQGIATEAARSMVAWLSTNDVDTFKAMIHPENTASQRVAIRLGFAATDEVDDGESVWRPTE